MSLHELVPWRKWEMKPTKLIHSSLRSSWEDLAGCAAVDSALEIFSFIEDLAMKRQEHNQLTTRSYFNSRDHFSFFQLRPLSCQAARASAQVWQKVPGSPNKAVFALEFLVGVAVLSQIFITVRGSPLKFCLFPLIFMCINP